MHSTAFFLQRMNDHVQYLTKIKATITNRGDFQGSSCQHCKLGLWLYGEGQQQAEELGEPILSLFKGLSAPHEAFHQASARALESHQNGDEVGKYRAMTDMHQLSTQLIQTLLDMDRALSLQKKAK